MSEMGDLRTEVERLKRDNQTLQLRIQGAWDAKWRAEALLSQVLHAIRQYVDQVEAVMPRDLPPLVPPDVRPRRASEKARRVIEVHPDVVIYCPNCVPTDDDAETTWREL